MILPDYVKKVIAALTEQGHEAYTAGGCVRDALLGLTPHDYDVTTSATPDEMRLAFADFSVHDTGLKHGTLTIVVDNVPVEVTTYRIDGVYSDNRRPDCVTFTRNLYEDLCRRDFTINAMAYNDDSGVTDLLKGREDLANNLIRAVGDPRERFREDGLRILRALRFAATYGLTIEPDTATAARELRALLQGISKERIIQEFNKLILGDVFYVFTEYNDVLSMFLPEVDFAAVAPEVNALPADRIARLAALFKPQDSETARKALKRLKYDRFTLKETCFAVTYRGLSITPRELAVTGGELYESGLRGSAISDTLAQLFQAVIDGKCSNDKRVLLDLCKEFGFAEPAQGKES
ncbi:MAG: hypothetical protein FWG45_04610 [Oscillospiraceae bacterium]|nr:hypothetical protein [Oscillospiraceae bacterium]